MIPCSCGSRDIRLFPMKHYVNGEPERFYDMICHRCGETVRGDTPKDTEWKWNARMSKKVTTWDVEFNDQVGQYIVKKDQTIDDVLDLITNRYEMITDMRITRKVKEEI